MDENITKTPDPEYRKKQQELVEMLIDAINRNVLGIRSMFDHKLDSSNHISIPELWVQGLKSKLPELQSRLAESQTLHN